MTLWLAVKAAQAFEVMLERWCGLGVWEYVDYLDAGEYGGDITTHLEGSYTIAPGRVQFSFEMPTMVAL